MDAYDFKLDADGDIDISSGDLQIVPSDKQHILDILRSNPGDFKEFPLIGWGATRRLNAKFTQKDVQDATIQLQADGYIVNALQFSLINNNLEITESSIQRP